MKEEDQIDLFFDDRLRRSIDEAGERAMAEIAALVESARRSIRSVTVAPGNLTGDSKCFVGGRGATTTGAAIKPVRCRRRARWFVFPRGEGTLDTTQLSNLSAACCDKHLMLAIKRGMAR